MKEKQKIVCNMVKIENPVELGFLIGLGMLVFYIFLGAAAFLAAAIFGMSIF